MCHVIQQSSAGRKKREFTIGTIFITERLQDYIQDYRHF